MRAQISSKMQHKRKTLFIYEPIANWNNELFEDEQAEWKLRVKNIWIDIANFIWPEQLYCLSAELKLKQHCSCSGFSTNLASLPQKVGMLGCAIHGDFLYTAGGLDNSDSHTSTAQKLDLR